MPKTVTVSGVGDVEFPDSMSDREIARAKRDLIATSLRSAGGTATGGNTKPDESITAGDVVGALGKAALGLASGLGGGIADTDALHLNAAVEAGRRAGDYYIANPDVSGEAQAVVSAIPVVGSPLADLAGPSIAVGHSRPPTRDENLKAVEGGANLAMLVAAPVVGKRVAAMRARGAAAMAPEAAPAPQDVAGEVTVASQEPAVRQAGPTGYERFSDEQLRNAADNAWRSDGPLSADDFGRASEEMRRRAERAAPQKPVAAVSAPEATAAAGDAPPQPQSRPAGFDSLPEAPELSPEEMTAKFADLKKRAEASTPEAAIAREKLAIEEFVRQRFPKATLTQDAEPAWAKDVISKAGTGKPGLSVEEAPQALKEEGVDRHVVYRDPDGKPVAVASIVDGEGEAMVRDFATDKSQGLLATKAAGLVGQKLAEMGVKTHYAEITEDAAKLVQRYEAREARRQIASGGGTGTPNTDFGGITLNWPDPKTAFDPKTGLPEVTDSEFGSALRTLHTGERDIRIADANNLAEDIRKVIPDHVDREALTLMRDFRKNPAQLEAFAAGTDPAYDGMPGNEKSAALEQMQKLRPAMERALNPTPEMLAADTKLTDYFGKTLQEGKDLGFLGSSIAPEDYVNHLLLPADAEAGAEPRIGPSGVNRYTPFAKGRFYPTVLDAVANGAKVRTLDAADALSIYGDKHGTAAATHVLIDTLKEGGIGKFATDSTAPVGWKEVGPGTRLFRNEVPYIDSEGNPQVAHQALYAPEKIAKALRPLTDPDYSSTIPGFTKTKLYQQYIKSVELGLSVFHIRALNLSAQGNMGIEGIVRAYAADMESAGFRDVESTMLKHGGTTSITGRTFEAYRAARQTSLPTRLDVIRNLPVFKQFNQAAAATSHLTFDILQRKFKVTDFGIKDAKWIAEHPDATPAELARARRGIAKEVNAVYGGLNWEALGVNKLTHSMAKALFLAPDWTFSNWQTAKTAFQSGPGGSAARAFWLRSAVTGVALTQLTSLVMSGKKSDDPTQVYLGEDHHGNDIYQNIYFAGAPSDMLGLIKNVNDYGAFEGTAHSVAAKLAPITRTGVQILMNRNYLGHEIAKRGGGFEGDVRVGAHIASQLLPVPFSASNLAQMEASNITSGQHEVSSSTIKAISGMLGDPTKDYTPTEFLTTTLAGTKPRHIPQGSTLRRIRGW